MSKKKNKKKTTGKSSKPQKRSVLGFLFKWTFVAGLWAGIILAGLFAWYAQELPDITKEASFERKRAIIVQDRNGEVVARYGEIIGNKVTVEELPPYLVQAVLSIEDRRFYHHFGLDPLGLARAMFVNVREGRIAQGGSTITQQLAKNLFLSQERTLKRKIQEAMLAVWLEYELTKDEILSAYLNRVYLGSGVYGVDAAARTYFKTGVENLTLQECATLAGLLKAPSRYSPLSNPGLSKQRTQVVLNAMVDAGYITEEQAKGDSEIPPKPTPKPTDELADRYYTDWIVDSLDDLIGTPNEDLIVKTTLDSRIQKMIQHEIVAAIEQYGPDHRFTQGAMIVMRPNGEVLGLIGGRNYSASQFNRATQALRPPGSAFKPFVYLAALEYGWHPQHLIMDEPITRGRYRPKNFGHKYYGEVTLEEALTLSLNTVSYQLIKDVGPDAVIDAARRAGIKSELAPDLSLGLGSSGITLLEMAGAYSTLANDGVYIEPYGILEIRSEDTDELYYKRPARNTGSKVFSSRDIQNLSSMMNSVIKYGTGQGAYFGRPAAGKTGTSQDSRDALFMGYTHELVGVVWIGNDDNSAMKGVTGGSYPARIWRDVMSQASGMYAPLNRYSFEPAGSFDHMLTSLLSFNRSVDREKFETENQERRIRDIQPSVGEDLDDLPRGQQRTLDEGMRYNN